MRVGRAVGLSGAAAESVAEGRVLAVVVSGDFVVFHDGDVSGVFRAAGGHGHAAFAVFAYEVAVMLVVGVDVGGAGASVVFDAGAGPYAAGVFFAVLVVFACVVVRGHHVEGAVAAVL